METQKLKPPIFSLAMSLEAIKAFLFKKSQNLLFKFVSLAFKLHVL